MTHDDYGDAYSIALGILCVLFIWIICAALPAVSDVQHRDVCVASILWCAGLYAFLCSPALGEREPRGMALALAISAHAIAANLLLSHVKLSEGASTNELILVPMILWLYGSWQATHPDVDWRIPAIVRAGVSQLAAAWMLVAPKVWSS